MASARAAFRRGETGSMPGDGRTAYGSRLLR